MVSLSQASSQATEEVAVANTEEITVRITVPASESGHDISVLLSPKKNTAREATPVIPHIEPLTFEMVPLTQPEERGTSHEVGNDDNNNFPYVANHRRPQPANIKPFLKFRVPQDVADRHPARSHKPDDAHFRRRRWYAVVKGYDVGVFFDFWGNVLPLVPKGKQCHYQGFDDFEGGVNYFEAFECKGEVVKFEV